jgi:hypothetical protein
MPNYECPRCNGSEYFLRNETVLRAGRTNAVNVTRLNNVQQKTPVCKKCQEIMNVFLSEEEVRIKSLSQRRSLLIFSYIICFFIGAYAIVFGFVQAILKSNGDEYSIEYYQSGLAMAFGIIFIYFFSLIRNFDKRIKLQLKEIDNL